MIGLQSIIANVKLPLMFLLILVSAVFGLMIGLYDFLLPLFLDHEGISYGNIGIIFSFSAVFLFFVRTYSGHISDLVGRKRVFSLSIFLCGLSSLLTPFVPNIFSQIFLRSLREIAKSIKEILQQLLVFDQWRDSFRHLFSWVWGFDSTFQGIGTLLGGVLLLKLGYKPSFVIPAVVLLLVFILFVFKFKEKPPQVESKDILQEGKFASLDSFCWSSPFRHRLPKPLFLIAISGFILGVGVSMSHAFIIPLFFLHKFSISIAWVSVIVAFHRLSLGLPMIMVGKVVKWNLKMTSIIFILVQGILTSLTVIPSYFIAAAVLWLMHDFVGASLWMPARNTLIQHYAREGKRGLDVGMVLSWQGLGWIFGPLIAGVISNHSINYPFLWSGIVTSFSVIPLFWLKNPKEKEG
jgi:DHA1 family multidrug resistance protein-like MFS transporter